MSTTVSYVASMRTRKADSSSNFKSAQACQEFYNDSYNFVGVIHFPGLSLANKLITGVELTITSARAGYGAGTNKTVYLRQSVYQAVSQSGVTGYGYIGAALGTFSGSFYGNTTTVSLTGNLLDSVAAYLATGCNTFVIYNPNPVATSHGYSSNYLQWDAVTLTVTYDEAVSQPSLSETTFDMGSVVTIYTNRQNTSATHTLWYSFYNMTGVLSENVEDMTRWIPSLTFAEEIPNATSGWGTLYCDTYIGGTLVGTRSCTFTMTVPASVTPQIVGWSHADVNTEIEEQFGDYVRTASTLDVSITARTAYGSAIASYRTTLNGVVYTGQTFRTNTLNIAGENTMTMTVTDSRGRSCSTTVTFTVRDYSPPSLTKFAVERCNADGSAPQMDGTKVRITVQGEVAPVNDRNTIACTVWYRLSSATAWTRAAMLSPSGYSINTTNLMLLQNFNALSSYEFKVELADYFYTIAQNASVSTKQVMMDFYRGGAGVAFGKVAENSGYVEFGWPIILLSALGIDQGGTGATTAEGALANLGGVKKTGDTMTGSLTIQNELYPSMYLKPTSNDTTNRIVFEGSYLGAASFAAWQDGSGNDRRMLEVRTAAYQADLNWAVTLRTAVAGAWTTYRLFHSGMETPIPIANGGTGASSVYQARNNLGLGNADNITSGILAMEHLPFKVAFGSTSINGNSNIYIDYSAAGFESVPHVLVTYSTTGVNWSGDGGAPKVYYKTTEGCNVIVGGNFSSSRPVDWLAIGN